MQRPLRADEGHAAGTLAEAYDEWLAIAANPHHGERARAMRASFERRTGPFGPDDACFEARSRAFWDDAFTFQRFVESALPVSKNARAWHFSAAHRGLFHVEESEGRLIARDVWSRAEFFVDEIDPASRDAIQSAVAPFDGRLVAREEPFHVALLPGAIFHPEEAFEPMKAVLAAARERALPTDDVLDALLRMEMALRTLARVKPAYAYRKESLDLRG